MNTNANASSDSSPDTVSGTDPNRGQPAGSDEWGGEPEAYGHEEGKPAGEDLDSNENQEPAKDEAYWERQYKELQGDYGKRNEAFNQLKTKFEKYGGPDSILEVAEYLDSSPEFAEFIKAQNTKKYGIDVEEDPERAAAVDMVEKIAEALYNKKARPLEEKLNAFEALEKERVIAEHLEDLSEKYPNWQEQKNTMKRLSDDLPDNIRNNPTLEHLEALYFQSLIADGKINNYAKSLLDAELDNKRANTSDEPPRSSGTSDEGPAETMMEALLRAKKTLGITGEVRGLM